MNVIHKFQFEENAFAFRCVVPREAKVVHVGIQKKRITLWIQLDPAENRANRDFQVIATGLAWDDAEHLSYVGTVFDEEHVWHVMESV